MPRTPSPSAEEIVHPPSAAYLERVGLETYRREYRNGYRGSSNGTASRKWDNGGGTRAWDDGYLDAATGRPMWHLPTCPNHDTNGCGLA